MNKNIKQLMESLFDDETDNILASDKDYIDTVFAEQLAGITIGKDKIEYEAVDYRCVPWNRGCTGTRFCAKRISSCPLLPQIRRTAGCFGK